MGTKYVNIFVITMYLGVKVLFSSTRSRVKTTSQNTPHEVDSNIALDEWLDSNFLNIIYLEGKDWWADMGLQINSCKQECLAWQTDSHFHLVKKVLKIPEHHTNQITSITSSKYTYDMMSQLTTVSGCCISPGPRAEGQFSIQYLQLYTTDKSFT